jgi:DNA-binding IscR family transcriptional regulator
MRGNQQFPVAVHTLVFIALSQHFNSEMPSSTSIAKSVNTNPVVIRRINKLLKAAGLIETSQGVKGIGLAKSPKDISLREIYEAVQSPSIFDFHDNVNQNCEIGSVINQVLAEPFMSAQKAMEVDLEKKTLFDVMLDITEINNVSM